MMFYFKLYIGHDRELQDLQMDIKYWLMSGFTWNVFQNSAVQEYYFCRLVIMVIDIDGCNNLSRRYSPNDRYPGRT
jgi:hypothetical protein